MKRASHINCICHNVLSNGHASLIEQFANVRLGCPVIHNVFLPEATWLKMKELWGKTDEISPHKSVLLLAYERGCLQAITDPIHRFLLPSEEARSKVRNQYLMDLREVWLLAEAPLDRHRKWRIFQGRLAELQFAGWLEDQSFKISDLEAFGGGSDIEASSGEFVTAFEIKFVGSEDDDFEAYIKSVSGASAWEGVSAYTAINYLTFRIYEAAKQLQKLTRGQRRTAVLIIDDTAYWRFDTQLKKRWVDWTRPEFIGLSRDDRWEAFVLTQAKKYPVLPRDLGETIRSINSVIVVSQSSDFTFSKRLQIEFGNRPSA